MKTNDEEDMYNEAYTRLVLFYEATNNQDALDLMKIAENAMAPSMTFFNWTSWLEQVNKLLTMTQIETKAEKQKRILGEKWKASKTRSPVDRKGNRLPDALHEALRFSAGFDKYQDQYHFSVYKKDRNRLIKEIETAGYEAQVSSEPIEHKHEVGLTPIHETILGIIIAKPRKPSEAPGVGVPRVPEASLEFKRLLRKPQEPEAVSRTPKPRNARRLRVLAPVISTPKKSLPPDTQNVQTLPFDSQLFDCYGKQTKRGFRAYCRRK